MYQIVILTLMIIKPLVCILPEVQPNCPISGGCAVIVFGLGKIRVAQLAIGPSGTMRVRYYDGGGWSAWGAK